LPTASRPSEARARGLWAVPIVLAVVLLVALGTVLAHSEPRLTGTNSVPLRGQGVGLQAGERLCQGGQLMPKGSGRMRLFGLPAKPGMKPEALVTIRQRQDGVIARAPARLRSSGVLDVPIDPPVRRSRVDAEFCVRNTGDVTLVLTGIITRFGNVMLNGKRLDLALTALWFAPAEKSWLSELGAVVPRVGHARIGAGWAFWLAALLLLSALGVALTVAIRENVR
jgi:hypothetical protein